MVVVEVRVDALPPVRRWFWLFYWSKMLVGGGYRLFVVVTVLANCWGE